MQVEMLSFLNSNMVLVTIITSLLSGIIGSILSLCYMNRMEKRKLKVELTQKLLGNRHFITGENFSNAMNQIIAVFHDNPNVLIKLKVFYEYLKLSSKTSDESNKKLIDLLQECCIASKIYNKKIGTDYFLQTFNSKD
ncbi:hypothetical protein J521_3732 [Acinetobacter baumannii 1035119]|nr:hypothetical protein J521_3732 [Acinetobacter baumannii 1035119]